MFKTVERLRKSQKFFLSDKEKSLCYACSLMIGYGAELWNLLL